MIKFLLSIFLLNIFVCLPFPSQVHAQGDRHGLIIGALSKSDLNNSPLFKGYVSKSLKHIFKKFSEYIPKHNIKVLAEGIDDVETYSEGSRTNILSALQGYEINTPDYLYIYFLGHGATDRNTGEFVLYDRNQNENYTLKQGNIEDEIFKLKEINKNLKVYLFIESCRRPAKDMSGKSSDFPDIRGVVSIDALFLGIKNLYPLEIPKNGGLTDLTKFIFNNFGSKTLGELIEKYEHYPSLPVPKGDKGKIFLNTDRFYIEITLNDPVQEIFSIDIGKNETITMDGNKGALISKLIDSRTQELKILFPNDSKFSLFNATDRDFRSPVKSIKVSYDGKVQRYVLMKRESDREKDNAKVQKPVPPKKKKLNFKGMVKIPKGVFTMGSNSKSKRRKDEGPARQVKMHAFYLDEHEVSNKEYKKFLDPKIKKGEDGFQPMVWEKGGFPDGTEDYPVTGVTWFNAREFCWWKNKRLPTEVEWERAAKGTEDRVIAYLKPGEKMPDVLKKVKKEKGFNMTKVKTVIFEGQNKPLYDQNDFLVYDMSGNAWEWVEDWYDAYPGGDNANEKFGEKFKVLRGGALYSKARKTRTSDRNYAPSYYQGEGIGFRCAADE